MGFPVPSRLEAIPTRAEKSSALGPFSRKPRKHFGPAKSFLVVCDKPKGRLRKTQGYAYLEELRSLGDPGVFTSSSSLLTTSCSSLSWSSGFRAISK